MRAAFLSLMTFAAIVLAPSSASAATCSDYSNQAAAQHAADTRDADGDGIYCESLPCPCSTAAPSSPGSGSSGSSELPKKPQGKAKHKPKTMLQRVGPTHTLSPGRKRGSACVLHGPLPDPACTPGAVFRHATKALICQTGYAAQVRKVSDSLKDKVLAEYGVTDYTPDSYEIDHLVPLELGGSNSIANLFPEPAAPAPGFHEKDIVEDDSHHAVCDDGDSLAVTQRQSARDWTKLDTTFDSQAARR